MYYTVGNSFKLPKIRSCLVKEIRMYKQSHGYPKSDFRGI